VNEDAKVKYYPDYPGEKMKNLIKGLLIMTVVSTASYLSACPSGFSHRGNNKCYNGYVPSCQYMAKGAKKEIVASGKDICKLDGKISTALKCTQGGTYKNDYLNGVTGLPPHMSTAEDYCIKAEKTVSCPATSKPITGDKGLITGCMMNKISYFNCPSGLTFAALKGDDVTGFACRSGATVKAATCPDGLKMGLMKGKPYCSGDVRINPTYK
jgi:hypothetical protein